MLLASHGLRFGYDILRRLLDLHQPTRIKTAHAACSIRPDVPRQRRACLEDKIILGSDRLVFVDERWGQHHFGGEPDCGNAHGVARSCLPASSIISDRYARHPNCGSILTTCSRCAYRIIRRRLGGSTAGWTTGMAFNLKIAIGA